MKKIYIILFAGLTIFQSQAQVIESDSLALVAIYNTLDGPNWDRQENWLNGHVGTWEGITVSENRVTDLTLNTNGLKGDLPDELYQLTGLTRFNFLNNDITGELKPEIGNMTLLFDLGFQGCKLTGSIPEEITNIPRLNALFFADNRLSGPLPDFLDQIPNLNTIFIQFNNFSGEIPDSWGDITKLSTLAISGNQITGTLGPLSSLRKIRNFISSGNNWDEQSFPVWLDLQEELFRFQCIECNFVGDVPEMDLTDQEDFNNISVSNNHLTGGVEYLFGLQEDRVFNLNVGNNDFTGTFPSSLIKNVSRIDIRDCDFDSFDSFNYNDLNQILMFGNKFTFETLLPHKAIINSDTVSISASPQDSTLSEERIDKNSGESITIESGDNADFNKYVWLKDGQNIQGAKESTLVLNNLSQNDAGVYTCRITNDTIKNVIIYRNFIKLIIDGITATKKINETSEINIFPNPVQNYLNINNSTEKKLDLLIYSETGQLILKENNIKNNYSVSVEKLNPGFYFIKLIKEDQQYIGRFIKTN